MIMWSRCCRFGLIATVALSLGVAQPCDAGRVQLKYLGTAGWEITDGRTVVLIDPFLTRPRIVTPGDDTLATDPRPLFTVTDIAQSDTAVIDAHIQRADFILITHTHSDHVLDLPYIAKKTGATVVGTESTYNYARSCGVPGGQLIVVRGGEDYEFGAISVRVVPSLHGVLRNAPFLRRDPDAPLLPSVFPATAKPPYRFMDLRIEGGTLAYPIRINGRQILVFGSMNYIEREVQELRPDVVLVGAMPERREIHDYDVSQEPALQRLQLFLAEVKAVSPKSRVIVPKYFEAIAIR
jgi:L-ascorbate metabolism protein UlaG (beta-lactamase superfamily)